VRRKTPWPNGAGKFCGGSIGDRTRNEGMTNRNLILKELDGWFGVFLGGCMHWKGVSVAFTKRWQNSRSWSLRADLIEVRRSLRGLVDIGMAYVEMDA
jgi:hypothetical protein